MYALDVAAAPFRYEHTRRGSTMMRSLSGMEVPTRCDASTAFVPGARVLGRYRIEQELRADDGLAPRLFLADDEPRAELVLLVVADSRRELEAALAGSFAGKLLHLETSDAWSVAIIELNESHLARFGHGLLAVANEEPPAQRQASSSPSTRLSVGDLFAQRYQVESLLGRGGMGEVYRAYDSVLRRRIALKLVRVDILEAGETREAARKRLLSEARVICGLRHPNIVEFFDAGEVDGIPYISFELCDGGTLRDIIVKNDAPTSDKLRWLTEIAQGLTFAHASGIIHRDVKPENVLLTVDGTAKISDFGIAKALNAEVVETGSIIGTPRYMAPEQLMGTRVDGRADQFAWALIAHELLTGTHPRCGGVARSPSDSLPPLVAAVVGRAMSLDAAVRFATFEVLLKELRRDRPRYRLSRGTGALAAAAGVIVLTATYVTTIASASRSQRLRAGGPYNAPIVPPQVRVPAAEAKLEAGIQAWLDGGSTAAEELLNEACTLDPSSPRAPLYAALIPTWTTQRQREALSAAYRLRASLTGFERDLIYAVLPIGDDPPDLEEAGKRLRDTHVRWPDEVSVTATLAMTLIKMGDLKQAREVIAHARLPAQIPALIHRLIGITFAHEGSRTEAIRSFEQCVGVSSAAEACFLALTSIYAGQGDINKVTRVSRHVLSLTPESVRGRRNLASSIFCETGSVSSALEPYAGRRPPDDLETNIAILNADFQGARSALNAWKQRVPPNDEKSQLPPHVLEIELAFELEESDAASRLVSDLEARSTSWVRDSYEDMRILPDALRHRYALPEQVPFADRLAVWDRQPRPRVVLGDAERWLTVHAASVRSPDDARSALAMLGGDLFISDEFHRTPADDLAVGRTYLLAGQEAEARRYLTRAAVSTHRLWFPLEWIRATFVLASIEEENGRAHEACVLYESIPEVWRKSAARSGIRAARKMQSIGCTNRNGH